MNNGRKMQSLATKTSPQPEPSPNRNRLTFKLCTNSFRRQKRQLPVQQREHPTAPWHWQTAPWPCNEQQLQSDHHTRTRPANHSWVTVSALDPPRNLIDASTTRDRFFHYHPPFRGHCIWNIRSHWTTGIERVQYGATRPGTGATMNIAQRLHDLQGKVIARHLSTEEMNAFNVLKSGMSGSSLVSYPSSSTTDTLGTRGFNLCGWAHLHPTEIAHLHQCNDSGWLRKFKKTAGFDKSSLPNSETSSSTGDWHQKTSKAANPTEASVHYLL
jgi:hypothetical protein